MLKPLRENCSFDPFKEMQRAVLKTDRVIVKQKNNTCMPFATHALLFNTGNWTQKAVNGKCQHFGKCVESAPLLLGSIKAAVRRKSSDSVLYMRGAKRNLIHTSLTCCVLKRLLRQDCRRQTCFYTPSFQSG